MKRKVRAAARLFGLVVILGFTGLKISLWPGNGPRRLHGLCRQLTRLLGVKIRVMGPAAESGLIVCNHLSYVDILVLAATVPAVFVAKREVRGWPVFGWFARRTGTIFVSRQRAADCLRAAEEIRAALRAGNRVVLFPEGTSSGGGDQVLPFKSSLLEAAVGGPVVPAALDYALEPGDGDPAEEVCYWKDMTLVPHLIGLCGKRRIHARLAFAPSLPPQVSRKILAANLYQEVLRLQAVARIPVAALTR